MVIEQPDQPFARPGGPGRQEDAAVLRVHPRDMRDDGVEDIGIGVGALSRKCPPALALHSVDANLARIIERRQP